MASQGKIIFFEMMLLIASVFVFKSAWDLLDEAGIMNNNGVLVFLLLTGILVTIISLYYYNQK